MNLSATDRRRKGLERNLSRVVVERGRQGGGVRGVGGCPSFQRVGTVCQHLLPLLSHRDRKSVV